MAKQYDSVAALLADVVEETDLRDWIRHLWEEQRKLHAELKRLRLENQGLWHIVHQYPGAILMAEEKGLEAAEEEDR